VSGARFEVRVRAAELAEWRRAAERAGESLSGYVRAAVGSRIRLDDLKWREPAEEKDRVATLELRREEARRLGPERYGRDRLGAAGYDG
jgi:hypothetical protein